MFSFYSTSDLKINHTLTYMNLLGKDCENFHVIPPLAPLNCCGGSTPEAKRSSRTHRRVAQ